MKKQKKVTQIGKQPPRYRFFLNPYQDVRFTKCPQCGGKTRQRKLPLFIHINPLQPLVLNKTCRYCPYCDLLIAHKDDLEDLLTQIFTIHNPKIVGNDYLVIGTLDKPDWKRIEQEQLPGKETLEVLHDFKEVVTFKPMGGWGR
jgi:hypothetical protein